MERESYRNNLNYSSLAYVTVFIVRGVSLQTIVLYDAGRRTKAKSQINVEVAVVIMPCFHEGHFIQADCSTIGN